MFRSISCLVPPEVEVNRLSSKTIEAAMNAKNMTNLSVTIEAEANPWRAGCGERRMSGSEGGVGKHSLAVRPAPTLHTRTVWVYRASGQVTHLSLEDTLSGEEVIPGFNCPVAEVFPAQHAPPEG